MIELTLADATVQLFAERAMYWPEQKTLVVADTHFGKDQAFRQAGIPVPNGSTDEMLGRLSQLVEHTSAERLLVLGDFWHVRQGISHDIDKAIRSWRKQFDVLHCGLVPGNHDRGISDHLKGWNIELMDEVVDEGPFRWVHESRVSDSRSERRRPEQETVARGDVEVSAQTPFEVSGHVHPGVQLKAPGFPLQRLACFWIEPNSMIMPAFNRFTGLSPLRAQPSTRVAAIADTDVVLFSGETLL